jgi:hypothetical protein
MSIQDTPRLKAFLWGAAHALDLGAGLVAEKEWGGFDADARALAGDWRVSIHKANGEIDVREAGEAE